MWPIKITHTLHSFREKRASCINIHSILLPFTLSLDYIIPVHSNVSLKNISKCQLLETTKKTHVREYPKFCPNDSLNKELQIEQY